MYSCHVTHHPCETHVLFFFVGEDAPGRYITVHPVLYAGKIYAVGEDTTGQIHYRPPGTIRGSDICRRGRHHRADICLNGIYLPVVSSPTAYI